MPPHHTINRTSDAESRRVMGEEGAGTDTVPVGTSASRDAEGAGTLPTPDAFSRYARATETVRHDSEVTAVSLQRTRMPSSGDRDTPHIPGGRRPKQKIRARVPAPGRVTGVPRLDSRILVLGPDECWPWRGYIASGGYGQIRIGGAGTRKTTAHRLVYEALNGPISDVLVVDHACHNGSGCPGGDSCLHRRCCNPAHLEAVTQQVNVLRGEGPGGQCARRAECPDGHPFDQKTAEGDRRCGECTRIRRRERDALRRDEVNALKRANKAKHRALRKAAPTEVAA